MSATNAEIQLSVPQPQLNQPNKGQVEGGGDTSQAQTLRSKPLTWKERREISSHGPRAGMGGPKPKSFYKASMASVQEILNATALVAVKILARFMDEEPGFKTLRPGIQHACEYVIDHAIGKAKQKTELTGGILTYSQLAKAAEELDHKPREIYIEEVARRVTIRQPQKPAPVLPEPPPGGDPV